MILRLPTVLLLALAVLPLPMAAAALEGRLSMDGADLSLSLDDGRVLKGRALVGLTLKLAGPAGEAEVRIDGAEEDASLPDRPVTLFSLSTQRPGQGPENLCTPDPKGRRLALPLPDGAGGFGFTCTSGAEAKCVLMGYRPWEVREGVPMRDLHRACIHLLRADYGGDDRPTTRDGTIIDIYDRFGIQASEADPTLSFEAAWGPDGALCVAHPRIPENVSLSALAERYPRLARRLGPDSCTEAAMRNEPGALLFNRSAARR
ncbi:ADYC domain-containing protein [Microvirga thermotolerans]|uniref:ADYC domain-containing protein n=1 Tax=Microvirga thermotolerans TaxID=2651334 RepID=A0A5P9K083_9HYPH|nr:ADYC domain-containing protein [Microvirga thermotolerans]QFU17050.1 hypothetical protein GDR74_12920 [Microvirga thermotolerans]